MEKKNISNKAKSKTNKVKLDPNKSYEVVGVNSPYLVKGKVYVMDGNAAEGIIKSGQGKLK